MAYCPRMVEAWPPVKMTGELDSSVIPFTGTGRIGLCKQDPNTIAYIFDIVHSRLWNTTVEKDSKLN